MYRKILLALDTSDHTQELVQAVLNLHLGQGAECMVFNVRPDEATEEAKGDAAQEAIAALRAAGVKCELHSAVSTRRQIPAAITAAAEGLPADLIVMGSRGLGEIRAVLAGSVSHSVITQTDRPILLVKQGASASPGVVGQALLAIEGSDDVDALLPVVAGLPDLRKVRVVHVAVWIAGYAEAGMFSETDEEARQLVEATVERFLSKGYDAEGHAFRHVSGEVGAAMLKSPGPA